jgi:hypothetical protein
MKSPKKSTPETVNLPGRESNDNNKYSTYPKYLSSNSIELEIDEPPLRGEGLNDWYYRTAIMMARRQVAEDEAIDKLEELAGSSSNPGEIDRQVARAYGWYNNLDMMSVSVASRPAWPERDDEQIRELVRCCPATIEQIKEASPHGQPDNHPLEILKTLHGSMGEELLCLARTSKTGAFTRTFKEWMDPFKTNLRKLASWEMCVPNLMRSRTGTTTDGRKNRPRTRDNACPPDQRRFIVTEIDIRADDPLCASLGVTPLDICASYIMGCVNPEMLKMVVMSGGKSLHPWLDITGRTDAQIEEIFRSLTPLGVDWHGTLPEHQFRLPNGFRADKQAKQSVIYFNPDTTQPS